MGRRSEQRIAISFPIVVHGSDAHGNPFAIATETYDISGSGASLKGLESVAEPGMKLEIDFQNQKGWYRVQWVGKAGTSKAGRIGVRILETGKYIWGVAPRKWEPDTYDPLKQEVSPSRLAAEGSSYSAARSAEINERRQFERHACRIGAAVITENDSTGIPGTITDISLGGCYIEMFSPLPEGASIRLSFNLGDANSYASGKVRSSQTGFGMGVSFTGMSPESFEALRKFAPPAAAPANAPPLHITQVPTVTSSSKARLQPHSGVEGISLDASEELDAIVQLLLRKGFFTRAELVAELEKLRAVKT